ncbi:phage major capsid protein [Noviherbaspirillum sp.]|jgi:HK97 family phage major capsid protein|uniref:phage major capsid protein n=1 Tax=Noviherbaspirillum sp. TaxID=1926288 RepID=UPI0025FD1283|nr:phage major capsid protein [Noviherbaspirillum sp.]
MIHNIKEQRALAVAEMRGMVEKAQAEKRNLNADEAAKFDTLKAKVVDLEAQEQRASFLAEAERHMKGEAITDKPLANLESRINLVDAINAQVEQRALTGALAEYAQEHERMTGRKARGVAVPMSIFEKRAAQTTTTAAGIVPDDFRPDQFVGLLRNALVVKSLGARVLPNLRGDTGIPRQKTSSTAQWLAEGDSLTDSGLTFDNITLKPRHVGAITELSRQLLQQANPAIEQLVRDDFVNVVSAAVDLALLHGDGIKEPEGIVTAATGTGTLATLNWGTVLTVLEGLTLDNIAPNYWLTSPGVATILRKTLKDAGLPGYLMENGQLASIPVAVSKHLANKAGAPATGRAILGDFSEMIIGTWGGVEVLANPYATGPYERGGVQIRILTTMDMIPRREEAFAIVDDIAL